MGRWRTWEGAAFLVSCLVFLVGPARVGFLSTDWDLLHKAARGPWYAPLEAHHWGILVPMLFRWARVHPLGREGLAGLALVSHLGNLLLLAALARRFTEPWRAGVALLVTAVAAAGMEALAWAAAVGYVVVTTPILASLLLVRASPRPRVAHGLVLMGLQVAALLTWDWGVLVTPLAATVAMAHASRSRWARALLPAAAVVVVWTVARVSLGIPSGYGTTTSPLRAAYLLVSSPLRLVLPGAPSALFRAPPGLGVSAALWAFVGLRIRRRPSRWLLVACLVAQIPYLLLGAPESRYFYLVSPFFSLVLADSLPSPRAGGVLAAALWVLTQGWAGFHKAMLWERAHGQARAIHRAVSSCPADTVVVVNLPDRYGPPGTMWRPWVWRDGLCAFRPVVRRVNTPGCPFTWEHAPVPVMDRAHILDTFTRWPVVEVRFEVPGRWETFRVDLLSLPRSSVNHHEPSLGGLGACLHPQHVVAGGEG